MIKATKKTTHRPRERRDAERLTSLLAVMQLAAEADSRRLDVVEWHDCLAIARELAERASEANYKPAAEPAPGALPAKAPRKQRARRKAKAKPTTGNGEHVGGAQ